jgi:hypothetical protein
MITFSCEHCGKVIKVPDNFAGKRGKCTGCGQIMTVPDISRSFEKTSQSKASVTPDTIRFKCNGCEKKFKVPSKYVGKTVKCSNCGQPIQIPHESLPPRGTSSEKPQPKPPRSDISDKQPILSDDGAFAGDFFAGGAMADEFLAAESNAPVAEDELRLKPPEPMTKTGDVALGEMAAMVGSGYDELSDGKNKSDGIDNMFIAIPMGFLFGLLAAIAWTVFTAITAQFADIVFLWVAIPVASAAAYGLIKFTYHRNVGTALLALLLGFVCIISGKLMIAKFVIMPMIKEMATEFVDEDFEEGINELGDQFTDEQLEEIINDPNEMFASVAYHLVDQGEFDIKFARELVLYRTFGHDMLNNTTQEDEAFAQEFGVEFNYTMDEYNDAEVRVLECYEGMDYTERKDTYKEQFSRIAGEMAGMVMDSDFGSAIMFIGAFIGSFGLFDLLIIPIALVGAYKIGYGGD